MKRLLRKSEFYDAQKMNSKYIEIFKNPTPKEMDDILKKQEEQNDQGCGIRIFLNDDGRLYAWDGSVLHSRMKAILTECNKDIHICFQKESNSCYIHSIGGRTADQVANAFKNGRNNFQNAGIDGTCEIEEMLVYPREDFSTFKTFEDIYEYEPKEVIAKHDISNRDSALVYINGEFIKGYSHAEILSSYLKEEMENRYDINDALYEYPDLQFACMHIVHSYPKFTPGKWSPERIKIKAIYIEEDTLQNITLDEIVSKTKAKYPEYDIFLEEGYLEPEQYDRYEKLARLIKKSEKIYLKDILKPWEDSTMIYDTDYHNRDNAFIIFDGKMYEGETHEQILRRLDYTWSDDTEEVLGSVLTGTDGNKYIAIYKGSIQNMTVNDAIPILKAKYPNAIICVDPMNDIDKSAYIDRVAKLKKKAEKVYLKDILNPEDIKTYGENTDYGNRYLAISYIDGEIYTGDVHKDTVEQYLNNKNEDPDEYLDRSEGFVTPDEQEKVNTSMGFASYIKGTNGKDYIAVYPDSLMYLDLNTFASALEKKFPGAIICEDNNDRYAFKENGAYIETL